MTPRLRTEVPVGQCPATVLLSTPILAVGSCFAETFGVRLASSGFRCTCNPTGILFNPESIAMLLDRLIRKERFIRDDLFFHQGRWRSFNHHSRFAHADPENTLAAMNDSFSRAADYLPKIEFLLITFGTSAVYIHKERSMTVANCHTLPHETFSRRLLTSGEIVERYSAILSALMKLNPALRVILTVSPVRHLRDDPHENSVSKARLMDAAWELEQRFPQVHYFPAFEIMMDELRDYRFYADDMAHPSAVAIEYLWEKFRTACLDDRANSFLDEMEPIKTALSHHPRSPGSPDADGFREAILRKLALVRKRYPEADISETFGM